MVTGTKPNLGEIEAAVTAAFLPKGMSLREDTNRPQIAWPRQVAMLLMIELSGESKRGIARRFGRSAATVRYSVEHVRQMMDCYPKTKAKIQIIREKLLAP